MLAVSLEKNHHMPVSSKRKSTKKTKTNKKRPKPYEVVKQKFVKIENNFFPDDLPFEKRTEMLVQIADEAKIESDKEYENLIAYFRNYDPIYLCSFASYYFQSQNAGIDEEAINGYFEFYPFYIEIIQSVALMQEKAISAKPLHENIEKYKNTITNLCRNQSLSHLKLAEKSRSQEDIGAIMLRSEMMNHTMAIRNWAYVQQMEDTAFELAELVADNFIHKFGFCSKNLLKILFHSIPIIEKKLNTHVQKIAKIARSKTLNDVFDNYEELFPSVHKTTISNRSKLWHSLGQNINILKNTIIEHSDYNLSNIYTVSVEDIFDYFSGEISRDEIVLILDKISYCFGDLSTVNKDYLFLDNPIHSKPFIKIEEDKYFSVIVHMFSHLGVDLLERLISDDIKLQKEYSAKKGKLLEDKVEILFKESFPTAKILRGSLWDCPVKQKQYENDLIILIEEFVIVVECKSGTVSPPARRGATDRLFKTLKELVVDPSEQAIRFQNYLMQNPTVHTFKTKSGKTNIVDITSKKYFIPLGVTLSNLGSIGCNLKKLIDAKVGSYKLEELAPSISFTDLEIIFELLPLECEKIHYLSRRREFEAHLNFQGDEMDLFCFYLENGFNIGEAEYENSMHFNLTLKSKEIDPFFIGKHRGVDVKKPILQKTKYWADILKQIENRGTSWLQSSYILLNLPKEDQIKFEKNIEKLKKNIIKGKCIEKHNYMVMYCGPKRRLYVIVGFPYKDIDINERNDVINDIIVSFEDNKEIRGIIVLGYNLDTMRYPYSVMAGSLKTNFFDSLD